MSDFVEVKTQYLIGAALDWAVAKADIAPLKMHNAGVWNKYCNDFWPSTDWDSAGPLIDKYRIGFAIYREHYFAATGLNDSSGKGDGPTHLIAACRAIVASVLGETVSVPKELV